ncbi:hemerythrin domain-containing protein [Novosphingobium terrae]|uniref:hemerythrin domain-containing protein n=1 Tax=Novosphingobium terrae TaxID=2726189 RepID=UPI0019808515|nr:hemerythrin domain-containing protein [Novosphingobium terrae]
MAEANEQPAQNESAPQNEKPAEGERPAATTNGARKTNAHTGADKKSGAPSKARAKSDLQTAIASLKEDHRKVENLFARYEKADEDSRNELIEQVCRSLIIHTLLEEEIFYPACREAFPQDAPLDEAQVEHDSAKILIVDLLNCPEQDRFRDAKFKVLREQILHHVKEEEGPKGIFAQAEACSSDIPDLALRLNDRKTELEAANRLPDPSPVAIAGITRERSRKLQESEMASYQQSRERDDRGRFTDHDDDRRQSHGATGRGRDEEGRFASGGGGSEGGHDRDYSRDDGRSRSAQQRPRDDDGRFRSGRGDYDDRRYDSRFQGRDDDRGHGGWFGDSQGHSEASRRGWDNPDHGPSGWRGDSRGHSEASRRGWDNPDHGPSGWYGDSRGHSDASRRGWDNSDHGPSGWYGDSQGHSEASRRGWDERGGGRDYDRHGSRSQSYDDRDDRGHYQQRARDDDDDRGRGHGGWRGDPQGHAEASRRGWENRR